MSREKLIGMLILGVPVEMSRGRFQDVRPRQPARGNAPAAVVEEQSGLRLRAHEAVFSGGARQTPGGVVLAQGAQPFGDVGFIKPFDFVGCAALHLVETLSTLEEIGESEWRRVLGSGLRPSAETRLIL